MHQEFGEDVSVEPEVGISGFVCLFYGFLYGPDDFLDDAIHADSFSKKPSRDGEGQPPGVAGERGKRD